MEQTIINIDPYYNYTINSQSSSNNEQTMSAPTDKTEAIIQTVKSLLKWAIQTCNDYNINRRQITLEGDMNV